MSKTGKKKAKDLGMKVNPPAEACDDSKCPFHGDTSLRGKVLVGTVTKSRAMRTAVIEIPRVRFIPKYERTERKRTRIKVHNPPCIDADTGDRVMIAETRPLSKTKNFVIVQKIGENAEYMQKIQRIEQDEMRGETEKAKKEEAPPASEDTAKKEEPEKAEEVKE